MKIFWWHYFLLCQACGTTWVYILSYDKKRSLRNSSREQVFDLWMFLLLYGLLMLNTLVWHYQLFTTKILFDTLNLKYLWVILQCILSHSLSLSLNRHTHAHTLSISLYHSHLTNTLCLILSLSLTHTLSHWLSMLNRDGPICSQSGWVANKTKQSNCQVFFSFSHSLSFSNSSDVSEIS